MKNVIMDAVFPRCLVANHVGDGADMYIGIGTLILIILLILLLT